MKKLKMVAMWLLIIGGINAGLIGLLDYNLINALLGAGSALARIAYSAIGLSALYTIFNIAKM